MSNLLYELDIDPIKINGKNIMITGGTGSFGNKMTETLLNHFNPNRLIIYSRDEYKQSLMKEKFDTDQYPCLRYFIGDVRDYERFAVALSGVHVVFHTSALKRVQECEYNPMEAIKTNILGTQNLIRAAIHNNVEYVIGLSTDKACSPVNLYGATKLCSEKLLINANVISNGKTKFAVVRYGNQLNSRGSLVEIFSRLKNQGNKLTITDPKMTRFTILLQEASNFVLMCLDRMIGGEIFIPKLPSYSVEQMAHLFDPTDDYDIIGHRIGEKMHELMISADESHQTYEFDNFYIIAIPSEIKVFHIESYSKWNYRKCEPNKAYSSGDNELISDQRLAKLIKIE